MKRLLASLLLVTSLPLVAQVYTYTDAQGNPVFTNEPPPEGANAQIVNVPPTNGAEVPAPSNYTPPPPNNNTPPQPPASQQQTSGTSYSDDCDAYGNCADDYDQRRAAEATAIERRDNPVVDPGRVDAPAIDPIVPVPVHTEATGTRR